MNSIADELKREVIVKAERDAAEAGHAMTSRSLLDESEVEQLQKEICEIPKSHVSPNTFQKYQMSEFMD